ncbi:MAG: carboxypeptidase regulatory-like domain-containing protein [Bacteroidetes bacterium]|nr:carboxypeptidase regulatory-like domain-containing protein [Bacteroidota bacterium]
MKTLPALLTAALIATSTAAQGQVVVTPIITPPYSIHLSDYQGALIVNLLNTTTAPRQVKLVGTITGDNGYSGRTRSSYAPQSPILLAGLENKVIQANSQAMAFLDPNNFQVSAPQQVADAVMQTGILPEGNYELCVQALDYNTNAPLSDEAPAGCLFFTIAMAQPPVITSPWCGEVVATQWPVFTWSPPMGNLNLANVRYDLYILELLVGQNPKDAIRLAMDGLMGNPIVRTNLTAPTYAWHPYDPKLNTGVTYVAAVVAKDATNSIPFENKGRSEACTFVVQPAQPQGPVITGSISTMPANLLPIGPIADTRIKGRLVYRFKDSGRQGCAQEMSLGGLQLGASQVIISAMSPFLGNGQGAQQGAIGVQGVDVSSGGSMVIGAYDHSSGVINAYDQSPNVLVSGNVFTIFPDYKWKERFPVSTAGSQALADIPIRLVERVVLEGVETRDKQGHVTKADRVVLGVDQLPGSNGLPQPEDGSQWHYGQVIATGTTGSNGEYEFFYHQPSYTGINLPGSINYFSWINKFGLPEKQWLGSTTAATNAYKVLMLEVASPYYCSPDMEIYAQPGDDVDLPEQACYVRSYDLKVTVVQGACNHQMGGKGSPMGNVQVSVLRPADHRPSQIPKDEGQHKAAAMAIPGMGEVPLVSQCFTKSADGSALFNNLVFHNTANPDEYVVDCRTSDERGLYSYFRHTAPFPGGQITGPVASEGDAPMRNSAFQVPQYDVAVSLVPRGPRVIGRVMADVAQPLPDAIVKLHLRYDKAPGQVPPVVVGCSESTETADFTEMTYTTKSGQNGFFEFSGMLVKGSQDGMFFLGPHASITVSKPGFWPASRPLPAGNEPGIPPGQFNNSNPQEPAVDLKMGLQWDMTSGILLKTYGKVKGTIQDEEGKPVRCDVQVGDGPWGRSETALVMIPIEHVGSTGGQWAPSGPVQMQLTGGAGQASPSWVLHLPASSTTTGVYNAGHTTGGMVNASEALSYQAYQAIERFEVPAPSGIQQVKLLPLSDQYFPLTVPRTVPVNNGPEASDLGMFTVKEKRHRLRVKLKSYDGPVAGATVWLDQRQQTSDQAGVAYFEFLSPESEFRLKVYPPGDLMPVNRIVVNPVSPEPVTLEVQLDPGTSLSGQVVSSPGDTPVAGARVWVETGSDQQGAQLNQAITDSQGNFTLHGVAMGPLTVHAAKADSLVSYIGTAQDVNYFMMPGPPPDFKMIPQMPHVELVLQRANDLDLTKLLGFQVEVEKRVQNSDGTSTISGAFINLPANANFSLEDPGQRIAFSQVKVQAGAAGPLGVPRAVPVSGAVATDMAQVPLKLYGALDATLKGVPISFFPGLVQVQGTATGGAVQGTVSSELSTFNFSYDFTGRFYLGDGPEQPKLDVFRSNGAYPQRTFNLMTFKLAPMSLLWEPSNAAFSLRGFPARSDRTRSFVEPGVFRIATVVQVKDVPDITPALLELEVGDIRVTPQTIEGIQGGGDKLNFKLNDWSFTATAPWSFNNDLAAIVIPQGTLDMVLAKAAMSQIMIRPNGLEMNAGQLGEVRLGGVAPLKPADGVPWTFGYDPGYVYQGKAGAWRFGALTTGGASVATVQGPAELVPSKVQFSSFSLFSRGQPLAEVRAMNYRYFNIMDLTPVGSMQFTPDGVDLLVNCSLAIHGLPQTTGFFSFYKDGNQTASRLKPLGATITTGRGNVYFKLDDRMPSQVIKPGQFTCYGRFRIDPEDGSSGEPIYAYGFLDHTPANTYIDLIRTDAQHYKGSTRQEVRFGGSPDKKMLLNSGRQTMGPDHWNDLSFKGNLVNLAGIDDNPANELSFTVKGAVELGQGKIGMSQLATPFGDMAMSYDFEHARLVGSLGLSNNNFGVVNIVNAQLGLLVDKDGFLVSCYDSHVIVPPVPWPLQDHHPAFMIGAHNAIPDTLLSNLMSGYRYKSLPATMAGKKLKGLFLQDKLSLIDFSVPSLNLGVMGVSGHASCAVEGRNWVDLSGSLGFGGMAYADVGLSFWLLSPIPDCSSLDLSASAEVLFEAALQGSTFSLTACGSTSVGASICGVSDSFGLTVKGSVNSQGNITLDRIDGSCGQ